MEQLQLLWKYQQIHMNVQQIESKLKASPARKKLVTAHNYLMDVQKLMKKMESDAVDLRKAHTAITRRSNALAEQLGEVMDIIQSLDDTATLSQVDNLRKELGQIQNNLSFAEREMQRVSDHLGRIDTNLSKIATNVPRAKHDHTRLKELYDAEVAAVAEQTKPHKDEMAELERTIEKRLIDRYRAIRKVHHNPVAPMRGGRCTGCNMDLPSTAQKRVETQGYIECENCGRLIFLE